jgi:hypothetical protein
MAWTPYQIEIILHHHCSLAPFTRWNAPSYNENVAHLIEMGVLVVRANSGELSYATTSLGDALVQLWRDTPLPVAIFVDPRLRGAA